jgi:uncharacterized membrane protein YvlD (DUF360 family)
MIGLLLKLIIVPAIVLLSDVFIGSVYFPSFLQAILTGVVLAVDGHVMERLMLRPGTLWITTGFDIVAAAAILLLSAVVFPGVRMPLDGALLVALILGIVEYMYHRWLLSGKINVPK